MLRVGVMLDSYISSAWVAKVIADVQSSDFARLDLVLLQADPIETNRSPAAKLVRLWKYSLFELFERWEYGRNRSKPDAFERTDLTSLLKPVPSLSIPPAVNPGADAVVVETIAEIAEHNLDVLLYFGVRRLPGAILACAKFGVWSFQPGRSVHSSDGAPVFRELYERNPVTESSLRILGNDPASDRVIYRSSASTDQHSLFRSRNAVYWKTAEFAMRRLRDLHLRGIESINSDSFNSPPRPYYLTPNALQMFLFMVRYGIHWADERIASLRSGPRAKWCIAIRRRNPSLHYNDPAGFELMRSAKDRFHADPFLFEQNGKTYLFFEDFRFSLGRAIISCCELDAHGTPGPHVEVLRRPYHLSYPFVFEDGGEIYMLPETRGNRTVELYRATNFPHEWAADSVLLTDIDAVDSTIEKIGEKYWMFVGISNGRFSNCDELGLFFADSLKGPWTLHPKTPLISDVLRARPAGRLFYEEGRLIRPSQDCGKAYGYALVFSEIVTLNETEYEERFISRLEPGVIKENLANHTYNRTERFEVVDRNFPARIAALPEDAA
jgi:hypothetical protein